MNKRLEQREVNTILAALRLYQQTPVLDEEFYYIAHPEGGPEGLTNDEIDSLCERINFSSVELA